MWFSIPGLGGVQGEAEREDGSPCLFGYLGKDRDGSEQLPALGRRSAQFYSEVVEKWRARQDETGHSYVVVIPNVS
jgi:hypothetical protein